MDGPFGPSSCTGSVQEQTHVFACAEHRIEVWITRLQQLGVCEESLGLHVDNIASDDDNVLDSLEAVARCLDFSKERTADDDRHRLRVIGDVSDLGAREEG